MTNRFPRIFAGLAAVVALTLACNNSKGPSLTTPTGMSVSSIAPNSGAGDSTTTVRILGRGFHHGVTVTVDGVLLVLLSVTNTVITATMPVHALGSVDVVVTDRDGETLRLAGAYTFVTVRVVEVSPTAGGAGDILRIIGSGFIAGTAVTLGDVPATIVDHKHGSEMSVVVPANSPGSTVDVVVTRPDGQASTLARGFSYHLVSVSASLSSVVPGGPISVSWAAGGRRSVLDWIGLFKVGGSSLNYTDYWWAYTNGAPAGTLSLTAPVQPGQYEFRYLLDDFFDLAATSRPITVGSSGSLALFRSPSKERIRTGGAPGESRAR